MNFSADIKLTSVSPNAVQLLITIQLFKQTKMVKICFDWNPCKSLHKQSLSVAQLDAPSDWRPGVAGSTPAEVGNILSWRLIMKYFLRSFSPFR